MVLAQSTSIKLCRRTRGTASRRTSLRRGRAALGVTSAKIILELAILPARGWIPQPPSMSPDGSDRKVIVADCHLPDGIAGEAAHIYRTNMGVPNLNDGSIERADLDGSNRKVMIPQGVTFRPKQIHLEKRTGRLYWCDREGMRVMRANLDGTNLETLVREVSIKRSSR